jgi:hypothetical protein
LDWLKPGTKASDYKCPSCGFWYQLKSKKSRIGKSIRDGAYAAMMEAIREDRAPSYFFLHYEIIPSLAGEAPHPDPLPPGEGTAIAPLPKIRQASHRRPADDVTPSPAGAGEGRGEGRAGQTNFRDEGGQLWLVRNLLLVPSFAFPPSAIVKCPPLSPTARRAGWIGCNFDLRRIPADARIAVVRTAPHPDPLPAGEGTAIAPLPKIGQSSHRRTADDNSPSPWGEGRGEGGRFQTIIIPTSEVREKFRKVKPLKELSVKERGWTLDVLNIVRRLVEERGCPHPQHFRRLQRHGKVSTSQNLPRAAAGDSRAPSEFTNEDVYAFTRELEQLHPDNRHIRDKIRQQLQVLRDAKLLIHVSPAVWRLP